MIPRPYQIEAVNNIIFELMVNDSTLLVMATGLGKTFVFCEVLRKYHNALIVAHRRELIDQANKQIKRQIHRKPYVMMGAKGRTPPSEGIIVASVQSLLNRDLGSFVPEIIIIDEAHHATASTYQDLLARFPHAKLLGVTATPDRTDQAALGMVFASVAFRYETPQAIADGWLSPIIWDTAHDVDEMMVCTFGRPTIIFTPDVPTAKGLAEEIPNSGVVYGEMKKRDRKAVLDKFKGKELQYIVNCNILTEGFDCPEIECVAMYRRTQSRNLFIQTLGRGLRLSPSTGKMDCLYLDLVGMPEHSLEGPEDPLAGRYQAQDLKSIVPWVGW